MIPSVAVFCRPVVPGRTKTRLASGLGEDAAARLYGAFLRDCTSRVQGLCATLGARAQLWVAGDPDHASLAVDSLRDTAGWSRHRQPEGDLGVRQRAALRAGLAAEECALGIGTDSPTLPPWLFTRALAALADADTDLVLAPAADGGYCLVGVRGRVRDALFEGVRWSSPHTLADALASARAAGYRARLLPPHYDVDVPADLSLLQTHLQLDPQAAPHTARCLMRCAPVAAPRRERRDDG